MENLLKIFSWLKSQNPTIKILSCVVSLLVSIIVLFACTSCGGTRAVARISDKGTSTITITTSNPTTVNASPNVDVKLNDKN